MSVFTADLCSSAAPTWDVSASTLKPLNRACRIQDCVCEPDFLFPAHSHSCPILALKGRGRSSAALGFQWPPQSWAVALVGKLSWHRRQSPRQAGRERRWLELFGEARSGRQSKTEHRAVEDECGWREGEESKTAIETGSMEMPWVGLGAWKCPEWDFGAAGRHVVESFTQSESSLARMVTFSSL